MKNLIIKISSMHELDDLYPTLVVCYIGNEYEIIRVMNKAIGDNAENVIDKDGVHSVKIPKDTAFRTILVTKSNIDSGQYKGAFQTQKQVIETLFERIFKNKVDIQKLGNISFFQAFEVMNEKDKNKQIEMAKMLEI